MEDNIQTIIVVVISVFLLFIFPVYMAYEKKDDISYALAMRYTQDFVDEVRNKGYITKYMYEDYRAKLKVTGNSYDIDLKHEYNRYDPITKYYAVDENTKKYTLIRTTTQEEKEAWYAEIEQPGRNITDVLRAEYGIDKVEDTYELSTQTYTTNHILNVLNSEKKLLLNASEETVNCGDDNSATNKCQYAYTMNVDDTFNVTIKNTNVTLATVIYNMVTANVMDENTRIYVNYGGTILSSKWYGDIDYAKFEPTVNLVDVELLYSMNEEKIFTSQSKPYTKINSSYSGEYKIQFDVKPGAVTELKEKGNITSTGGFNFALGNYTANSRNNMLSVAVGYNGILLMTERLEGATRNKTIILSYPMAIKDYVTVEIEVRQKDNGKCTAKLFVDGEKMDESVEMNYIPKVDSIGRTYIGNSPNYFIGSIRNVQLYALINK